MKGLDDRQLAILDQAASVLLQYPDREMVERIPLVRAALAELPSHPSRDRLLRFLDHTHQLGAVALASHYVDTFDFRRRSCLYLTYYADGDTRRRGVALAKLKRRYHQAGLHMAPGELPDFLPAVLEFTASTGDREVLSEHRPALELLRLVLTESGSPYALVIEALCATLPGPSPKDREAVLALAASGPPREEVGLEPYPTPGAPGR
jgi:nitrate reductase molybdenum cofactor assembly chaperone NarJ/NarW